MNKPGTIIFGITLSLLLWLIKEQLSLTAPAWFLISLPAMLAYAFGLMDGGNK